MARDVNRKFDVAAFAAIVDKMNETGSLSIKLRDSATTNRIRLQFYQWRKQEQELNADVTFLSDVVVRVKGEVITFAKNFASSDLRDALANAGVVISDEPSDLEEIVRVEI